MFGAHREEVLRDAFATNFVWLALTEAAGTEASGLTALTDPAPREKTGEIATHPASAPRMRLAVTATSEAPHRPGSAARSGATRPAITSAASARVRHAAVAGTTVRSTGFGAAPQDRG